METACWRSLYEGIVGPGIRQGLQKHGWELLRIRGSHHIYGKPDSVVRLSVPINGERPLKMGLLRYLMKAAELEEEDL